MMKPILSCCALLSSTLLLASCGGSSALSAAEGTATAEPRVERGVIRSRLLLTGELKAAESVLLKTPNTESWQLQIRWLVEDGVPVRAGDKVAEFDSSQLGSRLERLRASQIEASIQLSSLRARLAADLDAAEFAVESQRGALEKARIDAEIPQGLESEIDFQRKQADHQRALLELEKLDSELAAKDQARGSEIAVQQIALDQATAEMDRVSEAIGRLTLVAPRDGLVILGRNSRENRTLQTSDNTWPGLTVAEMPDLDTIRVEARLLDVDDGRVRPDMQAEVVLDAYPNETLNGRVVYVEQIAQQLGRRSLRRSFRVWVELDQLDVERMRPGMSVKVVIDGEPSEEADLVPRGSLDWTAEGARARLADGSWQTVELGACDSWRCIVEDGLAPGQRLARATGGTP